MLLLDGALGTWLESRLGPLDAPAWSASAVVSHPDLVAAAHRAYAEAGATVMLASHELDRTLDLATRHLTVAGGTIAADRRDTSEPGGHDAA